MNLLRVSHLITLIIVIGTLLVSYARLYFGVDLTDEAWHNAIPYWFAKGRLPFAEEYATQQTAHLLATPFMYLYSLFVESTSGIVLYLRHVYFVLNGLVALIIARTLHPRIGTQLAALIACIYFVVIPFNIPTLYYNTLALIGLSLVLFLDLAKPFSLRTQFAIGIIGTLTVFSYPPAIFAALAFLLCKLVLSLMDTGKKDRWRGVAMFFAGLLAAAVVCVSFLYMVGFEHVRYVFFDGPAKGVHELTSTKLTYILNQLQTYVSSLYAKPQTWLVYILALAASCTRRCGLYAVAFALVLLFVSFEQRTEIFQNRLILLDIFLIASPVFLVALWRMNMPGDRLRMLSVWVIGAVFSLSMCVLSDNGFYMAGYGAFPSVLVILIFALQCTRVSLQDEYARFTQVLVFANLLIALLTLNLTQLYRDSAVTQLHEPISSGPYRGLRTHLARKQYLEELNSDLAAMQSGGTILFYDNFPAGYLLSQLRPLTTELWIVPYVHYQVRDRSRYVRYYQQPTHQPDYVVEFLSVPFSSPSVPELTDFGSPPEDPFRLFFSRAGYQKLSEKNGYVIWRRKEGP